MPTKRTFVSVDLPEDAKTALKNLAKPEIRWIKWMKPDNFHITLVFLGEIDESKTEAARQILEETARGCEAFDLKFGQLRQERDMLWLLPEANERLISLQQNLQSAFKAARLAKRERRDYSPHILLAKSKTGRPMEKNVTNDFAPFEFTVKKINLYESRLTPGAATHILIESFGLI